MAFPASAVHGALSDHHRLIWQFGAVPLMYYLYGENVIIHTTERILAGPVIRPIPTIRFYSHSVSGPLNVRTHDFFSLNT
jgi:hypothetical protein